MAVQLVRPMTQDRVHTLAGPSRAWSSSTSSKPGILSRISVPRISSVSSQTGAIPLAAPKTMASTVEMAVASMPMSSETRPPYQIMENRSRPMASVPKRNSQLGATLQLVKSR